MRKSYKIIEIYHTGHHGPEGQIKVGNEYDKRRGQEFTVDTSILDYQGGLMFVKDFHPWLFTTKFESEYDENKKHYIKTLNSLYELKELPYSTEMDILEKGLIKKGISYTRKKLFDGEQIRCDNWDAICHSYSYGGKCGLLEISGSIVQCEDDSVEGYLQAEDILNRL